MGGAQWQISAEPAKTATSSAPAVQLPDSNRVIGFLLREILPADPAAGADQPDTASAEFHDGVLEVTMQLPQQKQQARKIEIHGGSTEQPAPKRAGKATSEKSAS